MKDTIEMIKQKTGVDLVSKLRGYPHRGAYKAYQSFFYTSGRDEDWVILNIKKAYPHAQIIEAGEIWKPFKGRAPIQRQSHWWVIFRLS